MFALMGSLLGLLGSAMPKIVEWLENRSDRAFELAVMEKQMEMQRLGLDRRLEEIRLAGEASEMKALYESVRPSGSVWIDGLRGSVRPVVTYLFFLLFACVKLAAVGEMVISGEMGGSDALDAVWDEETQAVFAAIIAFWFGGRAFARGRAPLEK